jgi:FkbM family methyltransferase
MQPVSSTPTIAAAPQHHSAISSRPPMTLWCPAGTEIDFIGTHKRSHYDAGISGAAPPRPAGQITPNYPAFDEEYFEWVDLLESVDEAVDRFVMVELGAGYGRWSVRGAVAARRRTGLQIMSVAVEPEPDHFRWMVEHFRDNAFDPREHELIWAAVGQNGFVPFWIGNANGWYGQALAIGVQTPAPPDARERRRLRARSYLGRPPVALSSTEQAVVWVPSVSLQELLAPYPRIDLIDVDLQGAELDVLSSAVDALNQRVRRIHIGTHSLPIEDGLRELFTSQGWEKLNDYPSQSCVPTPYGEITFGDGVQTWLNPTSARGVRTQIAKSPIAPRMIKATTVEDRVTIGAVTAAPPAADVFLDGDALRERVKELESKNGALIKKRVELRKRNRELESRLRALKADRASRRSSSV